MKKLFKKSLSLLMVFVMLFTCAPYSSAQESTNLETQNSAEFSGGTGLNPMVQTLSAEDENGYSIVSAEMQGKTATVELNNKTACTLVVAVYEEGSTHMLGCAVEDIEPGAGIVTATVDVDTLPQYYIAKVYLLNSGYTSLSGEEFMLCEPYTYNGKTKAYEQFLAKEPEDFGGEDILVFDDSKERTDFAVFTDDVILSDDSGEIEFTYNEETSTYTFTKAPDDLASLKPGDIYYYQYGEAANEFLLFKVKSVTASGSEVTVQADTEFGIGEAFSFVRIDADADFSTVDESDLLYGSGYAQIEEKAEIVLNGSVLDEPTKTVLSTTLKLDYTLGSTAGGALKASLSATLGFSSTASVKLYYDANIGEDFYEFKSTNSFKFTLAGLKVTGKISLPKDKFTIETPTPVPVGPFGLYISVAPVIEFSGSYSGSASYEAKLTVTADNTNGLDKLVDESRSFEPDFKTEFTVKFGVEVGVKYGWSEAVNLKVTIGVGIQFDGKPELVGVNGDKHHSCNVCIDGEANFYVSGSLSFNVKIIPKVLDFSWPFVNMTEYYHLFDFYVSFSDKGVEFKKGDCPNLRYKAVINVFNEKGEDISGATVSCSTGVCDSNSDGEFTETSAKTNSSGEVIFYLKKGNHDFTVKHPKYKDAKISVSVIANAKYVNVKMLEVPLYKVTVTVKDQYGKPVSGATFYSETAYYDVDGDGVNENTSATTNSSGVAVLEFTSGGHTVTTSCKGYKTKTQQTIVPDADKTLTVTLEKLEYHKLNISVVDTDGNAVSGASITVTGDVDEDGVDEEYTAVSSSAGIASLSLFPATYAVKISKDKYQTYNSTLISFSKDTDLSVTLQPGDLKVGDLIEFGSYPQSEVTDSATLSALNSLSLNWLSYGYYSGTGKADGKMKPGDFMKYADVFYGSVQYRAVKFTDYRPMYCNDVCSADNSGQDENGYNTEQVYWFKYEPLKWRALDPVNGLFICESIIDAQYFSNIYYFNYTGSARYSHFNSLDCTNYANDYATSSIRIWLNNDFYDTAFTSYEKAQIEVFTEKSVTNDKIFLLSYNEAINPSYGFPNGAGASSSRVAEITPYAKCQGLIYARWWLRTPNSRSGNAHLVSHQGNIGLDGYIDTSVGQVRQLGGIRPALKFNPGSEISESSVSVSSADVDLQLNSGIELNSSTAEQSKKISFVTDACVPNQQYVLLNVTGYGIDFKLSTNNLYYIDTVTADENGVVSVNFTQKKLAENSTTLLIGDFGGGIETLIIKPEVNIENPSVTTINYGDTLLLHASFKNLPDGATILWTVEGTGVSIRPSEDGLTCEVTSIQKGDVTVKATVVDKNGEAVLDENGNEIFAAQQLKSNVNLWQRIVSFFKNLFRISRIILQSI